MKGIRLIVTAACLLSLACGKKAARVTVEETREATTKDVSPLLSATAEQRFSDQRPSPVQGDAPENWLKLPAAQFRDLNYRFGESGQAEVYVSILSGSVGDNVNRWLRQFGKDPLDPAGVDAMEKTGIAGTEGVWVEADGDYGSGMGAEAKPGYGLAGVIAEVDGRILTVKMIGPKAEVEAEKAALKGFANSLRLTN